MPQCQACTTNSSNCVAADGCPGGYFYHLPTSTCMTFCPPNYYPDLGTGNCTQCQPGCLTCAGAGSYKCSECTPDTSTATPTKYYKQPLVTACLTGCPTGYWKSDTGYVCLICTDSCASCTLNETDCQTCKNVSGIVYFHMTDDTCLAKCPDGYFGDATIN
jgi:proprotein convertase subtilisin/kexin type 5